MLAAASSGCQFQAHLSLVETIMNRRLKTCLIALISLLAFLAGCPFGLGGHAYAQSPFAGGWTLQPGASKLNFQTIKSQTIVESSKFATLRGAISPDGVATVTISLDSVDTGIDLRNVRMRFLFFETFKFPEAVVTMRLNPADLRDLVTARRITLPAAKYDLSLHGVTRQMSGDIVVTMLSDTLVSVASSAPISVAAADFGLSDGVKKLEDANQVPIIPSGSVTFDFLFQKNEGNTPKANPATLPPPQTAVEKAGELDPEACAGRFEIISTTGAIYFRNGSADLEGESRPLLDSIVQIIQRCPKLVIQVAGHTDSTGNAPANRLLSEARANAVAHYLTTHGVAKERLEAVGFGDSQPVAPNDTAANRSLNRRIVFSVKSAG
jgi:outer membrane protein OmpA-like peptidoglycan-associated protein